MKTKKFINQNLINEWASKRARPVAELVYKSGCSQTMARQIINGSYPAGKHPTFVYQQKIAEVIGCEVQEIFIIEEATAA